jgi:predicted ester cyclase
MSTEDSKRLYRALTAALNSKDLDALDDLLTADFTDHALPPGTPPGVESFKAFRRMVDASMRTVATIEDLFAEGPRACARITVRGEHVGTFMGIPPTGKRISVEIIEIVRVEDGKIAERWNQRDWLGLLGQLGISPRDGAVRERTTA